MPENKSRDQRGQFADYQDNQAPLPRLGRKRDHSRDGAILDAAIDVLVEVGYVCMTMDMVARKAKAGKATLYRRWESKSELILGAIARMQETRSVIPDPLPDTGTVRRDLLALFEPQSADEVERRLKVMTGIASVIAYDSAFYEIGDAAIIKPWADACLAIMQRGLDRGEITATGVSIQMLARIVPSMAVSRALLQREPSDRAFLLALIDGVLMPALAKSQAR